ncbi:taurine ABC transporter substrate-binding protein [Roseomonas sp. NAR14]|uniref:Taurine ABC transporter substrate-binding protein n=1 Tax=Roseomonas acroporae TaxID=2937791 RepID=A0A9X2BVT9_9PROT|nr:taurine ABC transporter substrate-binding protein [Roseomonas acroporae]MCK8787017.1 taurine ABC transporter substrate-binding protein [Roseomonas acroporae]
MPTTRRPLLRAGLATLLAAPLATPALRRARAAAITFAHQDMVTPMRAGIADGSLARAAGAEIAWRKFAGGADVLRAMASGDVQIGEMGSSPIATAASQGMDVQLFWILDDIADAEQLVARNASGIADVAGLRGRTVAVPFVSTAHYQLAYVLEKAGLRPRDLRLLNMRPPEIAAAWTRGDIDAAFVWDPVLARLKQDGRVLVSAGDIARQGRPTFDGIVVQRRWAEANRPFMAALVKAIAARDAAYRAGPAAWTPESPEVQAVARVTGAAAADVPAALAAYRFPTLAEQASDAWLGGGAARALADTAAFLKEQGRVPAVAPDYGRFVTAEYVRAAAAG